MLVATTLISTRAFSQAYGVLMSQSDFKTTDMLQFSQYNYGFTTARSAAMGGAFASLGADLSSITINPAGLGMYRSSEVGISPSLTVSRSDNGAFGGGRNNRTRFALNNFSAAINVYEGSGSLVSVNLGFGYNKLADFNYRSGAGSFTNDMSIAEVFVNQLRGIPSAWLSDSNSPYDNSNIGIDQWGSVLAYKSSLIDPAGEDTYTIGAFDMNTAKSHFAQINSRGSIGEYSLAAGFNINNVVYLGASLGIQDIYQLQTVGYDEAYTDNAVADPMLNMMYDQRVKVYGTGVNFKLGAIVRPTAGLRIGVAVHSPTFVSVDREYSGWMYTHFADNNNGNQTTKTDVYTYEYTGPTRLQAGVSYTFGQTAILSVDYERVWYNGMRLSDANSWVKNNFKSMIKNDFQGASNVRAGFEIKPMPALALRGGFAYYGTMLQNNDNVFDMPIDYETYNVSAGLGFKFSKYVSLDLAYVYMNSTYSEYDLFYYSGKGNDGTDVEIGSSYNPATGRFEGVNQTRKRHNITLSLGFRF